MKRLSFIPDIFTKEDLNIIDCSGNITDVKEFTPSLTDESFYRPSSEYVRELPFMNHDNLAYDYPDGIENHSVDISLRRPVEDLSILSVKARAAQRSVEEMLANDLDEQQFNEKLESLNKLSKEDSSSPSDKVSNSSQS